jgi:hypothetical protein
MQQDDTRTAQLFRRQFVNLAQCGGLLVALIGLMSALSCGGAGQSGGQTPPPSWTLVWSDEFNGANGSSPDPTKWTFDTGGNGWGNSELEYYTARTQNAQQQNGNLVITALQETYTARTTSRATTPRRA